MTSNICPICSQGRKTVEASEADWGAVSRCCDWAGFRFIVSPAVLDNPFWQAAGEAERRAAIYRARRARRNTTVPVVLLSDLDLAAITPAPGATIAAA